MNDSKNDWINDESHEDTKFYLEIFVLKLTCEFHVKLVLNSIGQKQRQIRK